MNYTLALLIFFFTIGCANHAQFVTPAAHFHSPEVQGKQFDVQGALLTLGGSAASTTYTSDQLSDKLGMGKNQMAFGVIGDMGISEHVDLFVRLSTQSPHLYGVKVQLAGRNKQDAEYESSSFSLHLAGGRNLYIDNLGTNIPLTSSGDYTFNRTHSTIRFGMSYGYRFYRDVLLYADYSKIKENVHGKIESDELEELDKHQVDFDGDHGIATLGAHYYLPRVILMFEINYMQSNWTSVDSEKYFLYQIAFGNQF